MKLPFDLQLYFNMFFIFALEISVAMFLLTPRKLGFRFKPYLSIPLGLICAFGGSFLVFYLATLMEWNVWVNILVYTLLFLFCMGGYILAYRCSFAEGLLVSVIAYTIQHMAYQVMVVVLDTGLSAKLHEVAPDMADTWYNIILYSGYVTLYVLAYFSICRLYIKNVRHIFKTWSIIVLAFVEYLIINAGNAALSNYLQWWNYVAKGVMATVFISFCVMLDIIIVGCFKLVERKQEMLLLEANYQAKLEASSMNRESIDFINMKCHDLRKKIRYIKNNKDLLSDDDLNQIEESLRIYDTGLKTGNHDLDLLIQARALYCQAKKIELTTLIDGNIFTELDPNDVYSLFMNVIDNAVEAAEKVAEPSKRVISLKASKKQGYIVITERNYFVGKVIQNSDGSLKTSKEDSSMHGFGTKSIAYIVNKYGGTLHYGTSDDIFELKVVL